MSLDNPLMHRAIAEPLKKLAAQSPSFALATARLEITELAASEATQPARKMIGLVLEAWPAVKACFNSLYFAIELLKCLCL